MARVAVFGHAVDYDVPITLSDAQRNEICVASLDCGQEFSYNWKEMRVGQPVTARTVTPETQPSFR